MKSRIFLLTTLLALSSALAQMTPSVENRLLSPDDNQPLPAKRQDSAAATTSAGTSKVSSNENTVHSPVSTSTGDYIMSSSTLGYGFVSAGSDFLYGDEVLPPLEDYLGNPLTLAEARSHWRREPARPGEVINNGQPAPVDESFTEPYYYSPHAEMVFASQTGEIALIWVTAEPHEGQYQTSESVLRIGAGTNRTRRPLYWTEAGSDAPAVTIPRAIVSQVKLIYSDKMPATVEENEVVQPENPIDPSLLPKTTVWFDLQQEQLRAYNKEGRVLIEYLGRPRGADGSGLREYLGIEVIEVSRELRSTLAEVEVGRQILPSLPDDTLTPSPVDLYFGGDSYIETQYYQNKLLYYAVRENDIPERVQFYWLKEGAHTIKWPQLLNSYQISWPEDIADFEGVFVRPTNPADSSQSWIDLPSNNTPKLIYQDDPEGEEAEFDLQQNLFVSLGDDGINRSLVLFQAQNAFWYARIYTASEEVLGDQDGIEGFDLRETVTVGQRIEAPPEADSSAGFIVEDFDGTRGDAYNPNSYLSPYSSGGVVNAESGAIIPVNALPGNDELRVWWFKRMEPPAQFADVFEPVYIPSIVGHYDLVWPTDAAEIVLASNRGSGDLPSNQAAGTLYVQNDPTATGYNPNEEHALMLGGQAYALRDDLNEESTSSEPFVLLSYQEDDDRPAMRPFRVVRENAEYSFDYTATAGTILQSPMPLPLLEPPLNAEGETANTEVTPVNLDPVTNGPASDNLTHYDRFTYEDRKGNLWIYRGPHDGGEASSALQV
ncbi:hypothetical protein [Roseibacillus ishigakijimensis]|uniref:Uncharacterized protein n=1 Tax=Roseibacillus ishigakijimensis TaxID=454146 RepID=A0A934VNE4_9BACT|nr:hypothetical protein [Roseibacillus ishigakijimensis]MBK1834950.1 hypothetical protein [Roseibacillus ishigakijimensis]